MPRGNEALEGPSTIAVARFTARSLKAAATAAAGGQSTSPQALIATRLTKSGARAATIKMAARRPHMPRERGMA